MYDAYIIFELPEDIKRLMARYVRDGVEPEDLHVTLFSVGWIPKDQLGSLRQVCQNLTKILKPLKAETAGPDAVAEVGRRQCDTPCGRACGALTGVGKPNDR